MKRLKNYLEYLFMFITTMLLLFSCSATTESTQPFKVAKKNNKKGRVVYVYTTATSGEFDIFWGAVYNKDPVGYEQKTILKKRRKGREHIIETIIYKQVVRKQVKYEQKIAVTKENRYFTFRIQPGQLYRLRVYYPIYRVGDRWLEFSADSKPNSPPVFINIDHLHINKVDKWQATQDGLPKMMYDTGIEKTIKTNTDEQEAKRTSKKTVFD